MILRDKDDIITYFLRGFWKFSNGVATPGLGTADLGTVITMVEITMLEVKHYTFLSLMSLSHSVQIRGRGTLTNCRTPQLCARQLSSIRSFTFFFRTFAFFSGLKTTWPSIYLNHPNHYYTFIILQNHRRHPENRILKWGSAAKT